MYADILHAGGSPVMDYSRVENGVEEQTPLPPKSWETWQEPKRAIFRLYRPEMHPFQRQRNGEELPTGRV